MRLTTTLVLLVLTGFPPPQTSAPQPPVVSGIAVGVLIDVTVLDRNGRPVLDLSVDDFELTEEGARQHILTGTLVQQGVPRTQTGSAATAAKPVLPDALPSVQTQSSVSVPAGDELPILTAVLFDRLSAESRSATRTAALAYVSTLVSARDVAGVFLADLDLKTIQPFTNDAARLRAAVDRVAAVLPANTSAEQLKGRHAPLLDPNNPVTAGAESGSAGFVSAADREKRLKELDPVERQLAMMELRMEEGFRQITAEHGGDASLSGLRAVVDALGSLHGRKSILYFAETLDITSRLKPRFESLIGMANRSNVTVYTVDASGLRVHSKDAELSRNVAVAAGQGTGDATRGDGPWTKELERQEQLVSSGARAALGRLAKETGGFLLENTNNLSAGIPRIQQERTNYYLLGYQSAKPLDGKFRRVSVKVKRSGVTVKARSGYLAVPARVP
jgi:VWFA-related protein